MLFLFVSTENLVQLKMHFVKKNIEHLFSDVKPHNTADDLNIGLLDHEQHSSIKHFLVLIYNLGITGYESATAA